VNASPTSRTLRAGDPLPEFSGRTESGQVISRADLLGHTTVLYFYPKANSAGCTMEAREFARHHDAFRAAGVTVLGVSVDPPEAQQRFRERCDLPFELIADVDRAVSARFGVLGRLGMARRTTFFVGPDGVIFDVVQTWRPRRHVELALERTVGARASSSDAGSGPPRTGPGP
jgi:thioredoxin-dependent peroxiredoxin